MVQEDIEMPGENDNKTVDLNAPEILAAIKAAVEESEKGLKANRDSVLEEKRALKAQFDSMNEQWKGMDPVMVRQLLKRMENDEETKLIAEGKMDQVIQKRTDALRKDADTQVQAAIKRATDLEGVVKEKDSKIAELVIDSEVRQAAMAAKVHPSSVSDITLRARGIFRLTEHYELEARGKDGTKAISKDGKSSLSPAEWIDSMKKEAPHWWPASAGGGAGGGTSSGGTGPDVDKLSPRGKLLAGMRGNAR
jgi:hypothetical protein